MKPIPTNKPNPEDDCGEFAVFDTLDAIAAYVHHKYGEAALREVFTPFADPNKDDLPAGFGPRESLEDAAAELEKRGLDKPAAVLRELAETAISGIDKVPDHMVNAGPQFVEAWRRNWIQRRQIKLGTFDQELRRTIARNQRQSEINKQKPSPTQH